MTLLSASVGVQASHRSVVGGGGGAIVGTYQHKAVDATDASSYSFASVPIGTASATRRVVVAVALRQSTPAAPSAVTIGGVTATMDGYKSDGAAVTISLWSAVVPTGTTATVAITCSGSSCGIGVWELSHGAAVGQVDAASAATLSPPALTTQANDFCIAAISFRAGANTTGNVAWTGINERYDEFVDTSIRQHSGADIVASGTSLTVSAVINQFNASSALVLVNYR